MWLTTGAVNSLAGAGRLNEIHGPRTGRWIAERQYGSVHAFTGAAPGGFAWTHLSGGVPDADDTSGAVLACLSLGEPESARAGVKWLLDLQNADGGWPAFCRGWGKLPFDRSSPDITAHALRALHAFDPDGHDNRCRWASKRGYSYLAGTQRPDGAWKPLWFGNQATNDASNPVFGTSRSLLAYADSETYGTEAIKGIQYLLSAQNVDGGWGGAERIASSMEETALSVTALSHFADIEGVQIAVLRAEEYLITRIQNNTWTVPAPIGLYFSSLWYSERLYPIIWTLEALGQVIKSNTRQENRSKEYVCITES